MRKSKPTAPKKKVTFSFENDNIKAKKVTQPQNTPNQEKTEKEEELEATLGIRCIIS